MTRYTGSADGTNLAYQAGGDGPLELVFRHGTHPSLGRMCRVSVACARFRIVLGRPEEPHILGVTPSVVTLTDPILINEGSLGEPVESATKKPRYFPATRSYHRSPALLAPLPPLGPVARA